MQLPAAAAPDPARGPAPLETSGARMKELKRRVSVARFISFLVLAVSILMNLFVAPTMLINILNMACAGLFGFSIGIEYAARAWLKRV